MADKPPRKPNSGWANLRPAKKGEPSRNPTGKNGRVRSEFVAAFLEEIDQTPLGKAMADKVGAKGAPRIVALLYRQFISAMGKSDLSRKMLIEQYGGRPRQQVEITGENGGPIETRVSHLSDKELADRLTRAMRIAEEVTAREGAPKPRHGIEVSPPPTAAEVQAAGPPPGVQVVQEPPKSAGAPAATPPAQSPAPEGNMPPKAPVVLSPKEGAK